MCEAVTCSTQSRRRWREALLGGESGIRCRSLSCPCRVHVAGDAVVLLVSLSQVFASFLNNNNGEKDGEKISLLFLRWRMGSVLGFVVALLIQLLSPRRQGSPLSVNC